MSKNEHKNHGTTKNKQEKLKHAIESFPTDQQNQEHNIKKQALGPNTKR